MMNYYKVLKEVKNILHLNSKDLVNQEYNPV